MSGIRVEQEGQVRRIVLARVEARNELDPLMAAGLLTAVREANADADTRVILLEADGPVFCAGGVAVEFEAVHKPVVAVVKGVCISAGVALIAAAHVVVAAQGSSFGLTDIRQGRWDAKAFALVTRAIGSRRALELGLSGRIFSAQEALAYGLIHSIAPAFEIDDRGMEIAMGLAAADPAVVAVVLGGK